MTPSKTPCTWCYRVLNTVTAFLLQETEFFWKTLFRTFSQKRFHVLKEHQITRNVVTAFLFWGQNCMLMIIRHRRREDSLCVYCYLSSTHQFLYTVCTTNVLFSCYHPLSRKFSGGCIFPLIPPLPTWHNSLHCASRLKFARPTWPMTC